MYVVKGFVFIMVWKLWEVFDLDCEYVNIMFMDMYVLFFLWGFGVRVR